ncbi:hypothetical protein AMELA_G00076830 [Ameiurus melas]|uniref:Uncharacterized protein n=1 Tax=Ameiurus melas TaxID=219545 RepID=A0A7J6B0R4_AMEME|nr:hypothetical protein AMELA_G00076830 [Ameiurus melas]
MNTYPAPMLRKQCESLQHGHVLDVSEAMKRPTNERITSPTIFYPEYTEEEIEEPEEETEYAEQTGTQMEYGNLDLLTPEHEKSI